MSTPTPTPRQKLIREITLRLGGGMVDIELDPDHYDLAVDLALDRYRQGSANAMEESFLFVDLQPDVQVYTLPEEIQEVRDVLRRTMGATTGGGGQVDPFSLAFTTSMYLLSNPNGSPSSGGSGMLATYELAMQYQDLLGRMFGRDITYTWNAATKRLMFHRLFHGPEQVALHVFKTKPEEVLLKDPYARPWLRDFAIAQAKLMLGEAYSKFGSLAGPQGGINLKGDALKSEAVAEFERLEQEILNFKDSHYGMPFVVG